MAVNPKQKRELAEMWDSSKESGASSIPDGTYQFRIKAARFHMADSGRPMYKQTIEVTGGASEYVGEELEISDNLSSAENMGWFKSKLARLNVSGVTFDDIEDGTLAEQLKGKTFEGQVKTKGGFLNVYVNRLLGEATPEEDGDDEPKAKAKVEEDAPEEKTEDKNEDAGEFTLPEPEAVDELSAKEVKEALSQLGIDAAKVKTPRAVLHAFVILAENPKAKIELTQVNPLAEALGVTVKKGTSFQDTVKTLAKAVQEKLN